MRDMSKISIHDRLTEWRAFYDLDTLPYPMHRLNRRRVHLRFRDWSNELVIAIAHPIEDQADDDLEQSWVIE